MADSRSPEIHQDDQINLEASGPEVVRIVPKGSSLASSAERPEDVGVSYIGGQRHGSVQMVPTGVQDEEANVERPPTGLLANWRLKRRGWGKYIKTKEFWVVLVFGQVLSLLLTGQNTTSQLLSIDKVSIPAFQSFFNYFILNVVFTSYTLYRYGFKKWLKLCWNPGWKYFLWAFVDVEGNYFFILAYRYTNILSATLIDFWAIAVVVAVSLIFLKVRYHLFQYIGILICIGGLGIILGSDYIHGNTDGYQPKDAVKGDLFALLGATFYGLSNVLQEFYVSKAPVYEALGQLGFWGTIINGAQAGIFEHKALVTAHWSPSAGGWFGAFTVLLSAFYMAVPIFMRLASAAVFNISLLTSDFWSVIVGVKVFHLTIHWMYPIAFCCIVLGLLTYFLTEGVLGDSAKPWLGENQEKGVSGLGTAKRKLEKAGVIPPANATIAGPEMVEVPANEAVEESSRGAAAEVHRQPVSQLG